MVGWVRTNEDVHYGVAIYNYASDGTHQLSLDVGETVEIVEQYAGLWYRGFALRDRQAIGIFPASFIQLFDCTCHIVESENGPVTVTVPKEDSCAVEAAATIRQWGRLARDMFMQGKMDVYNTLRASITEVILLRRHALSGTLPHDQLLDMRRRIADKIDRQNRTLGFDLVPRDNIGNLVDHRTKSVIDLFRLHQSIALAYQNEKASRTQPRAESVEISPSAVHHVIMKVTQADLTVYEEAEMLFSIYSTRPQKLTGGPQFHNEDFYVRVSNRGKLVDVDKPERLQTIFEDLSDETVNTYETYLVCRIFTIGRMEPSESTVDTRTSLKLRRPCGVGVLNMTKVVRDHSSEELDEHFDMYSCNNIATDSEMPFLHSHIIANRVDIKKFPKMRGLGVRVALRVFHGEPEKLKEEMLKEAHWTRKLGFPEIVYPGNKRNDFYVSIGSGDFPANNKRGAANIECVMAVMLDSGEVLNDCIILPNERNVSEYCSTIYYHTHKPTWHETVRLHIPHEKSKRNPHLRFIFRLVSSKEEKSATTWAFSFLRLLAEDGTVIDDGQHVLPVYRYSPKVDSPTVYLHDNGTLNANSTVGSNVPQPQRNKGESFSITTQLCSTKVTQNATLLGLLKWSSNKPTIGVSLQRMVGVDPNEVVKFLEDIFNALFCILDHDADRFKMLVFDVLIYIIGIPAQPRYEHFRAVLNVYIQKHFSGAMAHSPLLSCLTAYVTSAATGDKTPKEKIKSTLRALEYIFKFVVQSRVLYAQANRGADMNEFKQEVLRTLGVFYELMSKTDPKTISDIQVVPLQHLYSIFEDLKQIFSPVELAEVAQNFINAMPLDTSPTVLVEWKLKFLDQIVNGFLFEDPKARARLFPFVLRHLRANLRPNNTLATDLKVLMDLLNMVKADEPNGPTEIRHLADMMLRPLLSMGAKTVSKSLLTRDDAMGVITSLYHLLDLMPASEYARVVKMHQDEGPSHETAILSEVLGVVGGSVTAPVYPTEWFFMLAVRHRLSIKAFLEVTPALKRQVMTGAEAAKLTNAPPFDRQLWELFFQVCVAFVQQPHLQIEMFPEHKQRLVLEQFGDMRLVLAGRMKEMWESLGRHKQHFVPSFVARVLQVSLMPKQQLRSTLLQMFFDVVVCEFGSSSQRSFSKSERQAIDNLDIFFGEGHGDHDYKEQFAMELLPRFDQHPGLRDKGRLFVKTVTHLLELLLEIRELGDSDQRSNERAAVMLKLMRFFKDIGRDEMYEKYLQRLCELNLRDNNFTEAAFALWMHASHLDWADDDLLPPMGNHPAQTSRQRKASLYMEIIENLDKGKAWEKAIELCKELAHQYEREMVDYTKMSQVLQRQAGFFHSIVTQPRGFSTYYRVGFYGQDCPLSVRNREFVYRGAELEDIGTFSERILAQYPGSKRTTSNKPPGPEVREAEGIFVQIVKVTPVPEIPSWMKGKDPADAISAYYKVNEVNQFYYAVPMKKKTGREIEYTDPSWAKDFAKTVREIASLWQDKVVLMTEERLPGILRRSAVIPDQTVRREIAPIEEAVRAIEERNETLAKWNRKYGSAQPPQYQQAFSQDFNGTIEAAVNGGTKVYEIVFFDERYVKMNPDHADMVESLRQLMAAQMSILEVGVKLHDRVVPPEMRALHDRMTQVFKKMKAERGIVDDSEPSSAPGAAGGADDTAGGASVRHSSSSVVPSTSSSNLASLPGGGVGVGNFGTVGSGVGAGGGDDLGTSSKHTSMQLDPDAPPVRRADAVASAAQAAEKAMAAIISPASVSAGAGSRRTSGHRSSSITGESRDKTVLSPAAAAEQASKNLLAAGPSSAPAPAPPVQIVSASVRRSTSILRGSSNISRPVSRGPSSVILPGQIAEVAVRAAAESISSLFSEAELDQLEREKREHALGHAASMKAAKRAMRNSVRESSQLLGVKPEELGINDSILEEADDDSAPPPLEDDDDDDEVIATVPAEEESDTVGTLTPSTSSLLSAGVTSTGSMTNVIDASTPSRSDSPAAAAPPPRAPTARTPRPPPPPAPGMPPSRATMYGIGTSDVADAAIPPVPSRPKRPISSLLRQNVLDLEPTSDSLSSIVGEDSVLDESSMTNGDGAGNDDDDDDAPPPPPPVRGRSTSVRQVSEETEGGAPSGPPPVLPPTTRRGNSRVMQLNEEEGRSSSRPDGNLPPRPPKRVQSCSSSDMALRQAAMQASRAVAAENAAAASAAASTSPPADEPSRPTPPPIAPRLSNTSLSLTGIEPSTSTPPTTPGGTPKPKKTPPNPPPKPTARAFSVKVPIKPTEPNARPNVPPRRTPQKMPPTDASEI